MTVYDKYNLRFIGTTVSYLVCYALMRIPPLEAHDNQLAFFSAASLSLRFCYTLFIMLSPGASTSRIALALGAAVLCTAFTILGAWRWAQDPWTVWPAERKRPFYGYTLGGLAGLFAMITFAPIAFATFLSVGQVALQWLATNVEAAAAVRARLAAKPPGSRLGRFVSADEPSVQQHELQQQQARSSYRRAVAAYLGVAFLALAALVGLTIAGWYVGAHWILSCRGGLFCIASASHIVPPDPEGTPSATRSWWGSTGAMVMFAALLFGAAIAARVVVDTVKIIRGSHTAASAAVSTTDNAYAQLGDASAANDQKPVLRSSVRPLSLRGLFALYACCLVAAFLLLLVGGYLPNGFYAKMTPAGLASAARRAAVDIPAVIAAAKANGTDEAVAAQCKQRNLFTCPELPDATMITKNLRLADEWVVKLYPSNVIFYIFVALFPLVALLMRSVPALDRIGSAKLRVRRCSPIGALKRLCAPLCCRRSAAPDAGKAGHLQQAPQLSRSLLSQDGSNSNSSSLTVAEQQKAAPRARMAFFTVREILALLSVLAMALLFFSYWFFDHNWNAKFPNKKLPTLVENWCRTLGQVATLFFALLLFPAARNSPVLALLGVSWEAAIQYHRWLGTAFLAVTAAHAGVAIKWYDDKGGLPGDLVRVPMLHAPHSNNFTIPLAHWATLATFIFIGGFSLIPRVRRACYELFLYAHLATYLLLTPTVLWHAQASWVYLAPGMLIWAGDKAVRLFRSTRAVELRPIALPPTPARPRGTVVMGAAAFDCGAAGQVVELRVSAKSLQFATGQYAFINVAELSLFEWHPMTVSSASVYAGRTRGDAEGSADNDVTFHIKAMGAKTWTDALYNHVLAHQQKQLALNAANPDSGMAGAVVPLPLPLTVALDGPYGRPLDWENYDDIVLVGGGIGSTPCKSVFETVLNHKRNVRSGRDNAATAGSAVEGPRVHLVCVARDASLFDCVLRDTLSGLPLPATTAQHVKGKGRGGIDDARASYITDDDFTVQLFVTNPSTSASAVVGGVDATEYYYYESDNEDARSTLPAPGSVDSIGNDHGFEYAVSPLAPVPASKAASARVDASRNIAASAVAESGASTAVASRLAFGRPDLDAVIPATITRAQPGHMALYQPQAQRGERKTLVFVCGPQAVVEECEALAHTHGYHFHAETFTL